MVFPLIILVSIPFDMPVESNEDLISEEPDDGILYFMLMGIWVFFLLRILILLKRGRYRLAQRY